MHYFFNQRKDWQKEKQNIPKVCFWKRKWNRSRSSGSLMDNCMQRWQEGVLLFLSKKEFREILQEESWKWVSFPIKGHYLPVPDPICLTPFFDRPLKYLQYVSILLWFVDDGSFYCVCHQNLQVFFLCLMNSMHYVSLDIKDLYSSDSNHSIPKF